MKKLIIPLLFIFAIGILAAVESEPSEVVGYVKYPCVVGDNFVAMPMNDGHTVVSEVTAYYNATQDIIMSVNIYDPIIQGWSACTNYGGNYFEPDPEISIGTPLFLYSYANFVWPSGPRSINSSPVRGSK